MMLEDGIWADGKPEAVFGIHVGIGVPGGEFAIRPGPLMAAADSFKITIRGKQTHGARPWDGVDPIVVASQVVLGLQTIASRTVDVTRAPSIISVGRISGGIRSNVIPDEVVMEGTIRSFDEATRRDIHDRVRSTATGIAGIAGAEAVVELDIGQGTPSVYNDPDLLARMMPSMERVAAVNAITPQTVAEDFSVYARETPGLFVFLGNAAPGTDLEGMPVNHSPYFDMHEPNLEVGVRVFSHLVVDYLQK
jgi:amidohydrolase